METLLDKPIDGSCLNPLPLKFYQLPVQTVAQALLGKGLFVGRGQKKMLLAIVETEAYGGSDDPASHAYRGVSPRNQVMFLGGGHCYVYLSYGVNYCMNVVTGEEGVGEAVLLRAGVPLSGVRHMSAHRGMSKGDISDNPPFSIRKKLASGPGKLTQALGLDLRYNGRKFRDTNFKIVDLGVELSPRQIGRSPRIGISKATEKRLRYFVRSSRWLSRPDKHR